MCQHSSKICPQTTNNRPATPTHQPQTSKPNTEPQPSHFTNQQPRTPTYPLERTTRKHQPQSRQHKPRPTNSNQHKRPLTNSNPPTPNLPAQPTTNQPQPTNPKPKSTTLGCAPLSVPLPCCQTPLAQNMPNRRLSSRCVRFATWPHTALAQVMQATLRFVPHHLLQEQRRRRATTPVLPAAFAIPAANWLTSVCRTAAATSDMARPAINYLPTRLLP